MTMKVQHILREGNTIVDYFTNLDYNFESTFECQHFQDIPIAGRKIINTDKHGISHLKIGQSWSVYFRSLYTFEG